ncbi:MAG TPA: VWA domain-containing protein [Verrucomicrobiae bacterium]|nr:VWA domain-containing protein [Verrucomicrobiae bacterium]
MDQVPPKLGPAVMLRLTDPAWLLALVPLALVGLRGRRPDLPRRPRPSRLLLTLLPGTAVVLVVLGLAGPELETRPRPVTVLAIDRSWSIDKGMRAEQGLWFRSLATVCPRPCRVVEFGRAASALAASAQGLATHPLRGRAAGATDIAAGVRLAIALAPPGGRVVVLSDGAASAGDTLAAVPQARARRVQIDGVRLTGPVRRDAAITQLEAPSTLHAGDPLPLAVTVRSTVTARATLVLSLDGRPAGARTLVLHPGDTPLQFRLVAPGPGWTAVTARIRLPGDAIPQNDELATVLDVGLAPRVLAVGPGRGPGAPLVSLLRGLRLRVRATAAGRLPGTAAGYAGFDSLILDDVPATALSTLQVAAMAAAVRDKGLGLVVLGGPHSFSLGGYAQSPLQRLLPVASRVPGNLQHGNLAIELVLDHSGSMSEPVAGVPEIDLVQRAGVATAHFVAAHGDDLGVVDFDVAAHLLVPMQRVAGAAATRRVVAAIDGLQATGGTDIYAGLLAGGRQIERSAAPIRHLILMTDGISQPEDYTPLLRALRRAHITVATVALGAGADTTLLRTIARATGGHFYATATARQLPRIFAREARIAVQPVAVTGSVRVLPGRDSPLVASLAGGRLPALSGTVLTQLASGAQADLLARGPSGQLDPALAQWQLGLGRVVAWIPGLGGQWAGAWTGRTGMWNDIVRWADRGAGPSPPPPTVVPGSPPWLELDLAPLGAAALGVRSVSGVLVDPAGGVIRLDFTEVGPGLYRAWPRRLPAGVDRYRIAAVGVARLVAVGEIAVPYSEEYRPLPSGATPLAQLVARTAGRMLPVGDPQVLTQGGWQGLGWPLALAALATFVAGACGRLLGRARPAMVPSAPVPPPLRAGPPAPRS